MHVTAYELIPGVALIQNIIVFWNVTEIHLYFISIISIIKISFIAHKNGEQYIYKVKGTIPL